jgi:hypothetical protein
VDGAGEGSAEGGAGKREAFAALLDGGMVHSGDLMTGTTLWIAGRLLMTMRGGEHCRSELR